MYTLVDTIFPMRGWPIALIIVLTQFIASNIVNIMGYRFLSKLYPIYKTRKLEKDGKIYQTIFHIKGWKELIPSISSFNKKSIYKKRRITEEYVEQYLLEGVRAELCHDLAVFFALIVLFLSVPSSWFFIIAYTILLNVPCIVIQRYNRPRFQRLCRSRDAKGDIDFTPLLISMKKQKAKDEKEGELTDAKNAPAQLEKEKSEIQEEGK